MPAKLIARRDVRLVLDRVVDRGSPIMVNRTLALVRKIFAFAVEEDILQANPCLGLRAPSREKQRDRVLSQPEIAALWRALDAEPDDLAALFKLYLLTAQRRSEGEEPASSSSATVTAGECDSGEAPRRDHGIPLGGSG